MKTTWFVLTSATLFAAPALALAQQKTVTAPKPVKVGTYKGKDLDNRNKACTVEVLEFKRTSLDGKPIRLDLAMSHWNVLTTVKLKLSAGRKGVVYELKSRNAPFNTNEMRYDGKHKGKAEWVFMKTGWMGQIEYVSYERKANLLKLDRGAKSQCSIH